MSKYMKIYEVAIGALLHDIGKVMQRAELEKEYPVIIKNYSEFCPYYNNYFTHLHAAHTAYFIEKCIPEGLINKEELYNAARHHINPDDDIYKISDLLSSGMERYTSEQDSENFKEVRLHSIFDMIELQYRIKDKDGKINSRWKHRLAPSVNENHFELFPSIETDDNLQFTYRDLWNSFEKEIRSLTSIKSISTYFNELYWLLEKYTSCIPSATNAFPDISLFDHSKTTAAIASALYIFRQSKEDTTNEFILYGGDISGIQDYIFKISQSQGIGGIAKRLRGRSFYIAMLSEVLARYIICKTGLTIANINFCGGGNFEILLPNTKSVTNFLSDFERDVNSWLIEQFYGELGFVGASVCMSKNELLNSYPKKKEALNDALTLAKLKKFSTHLNGAYHWSETLTGGYKKVCRSCNINIVKNKEEICNTCEMDKIIGEKLPKAKYISFSDESFNKSMRFGKFGNVTLWDEEDDFAEVKSRFSYLYALGEDSNQVKAIYRMAKTVPTALKTIQLETEKDERDDKTVHEGQPLSFTTLADMATGDKRIGILKMDVDNLGFLFSMGLDFFNTENKQINLSSISRLATLSRQITSFFTMHLDNICKEVFLKWQKNPENNWEHKYNISNIFYIIFSGGDDLVIVGPWDMIIELAKEIRRYFKDFTCHNPNLTISAGIYICKPKYPIQHAVAKAEEALKQSKSKGRNRITVMGETFVWDHEDERSRINQEKLKEYYSNFIKNEIAEEKIFINGAKDERYIPTLTFNELFEFGNYLDHLLKNNFISHNFIRALLEANRQYFDVIYNEQEERHEEIHYMMFLPYLLYTIERNVHKEKKDELKVKLITSGDSIKYVRQALFPCKYVLMKNR